MCAHLFMKVVNQEDEYEEADIDEGELLHWAEWAKDVYRQMEKIDNVSNEFRYYVQHESAESKRIWRAICPSNIGFDYTDKNPCNVNAGIELWNECLKKVVW